MLTECNYVGRLLKYLQTKIILGKNLRNNRISEFLPDTCTCKIQVCMTIIIDYSTAKNTDP